MTDHVETGGWRGLGSAPRGLQRDPKLLRQASPTLAERKAAVGRDKAATSASALWLAEKGRVAAQRTQAERRAMAKLEPNARRPSPT